MKRTAPSTGLTQRITKEMPLERWWRPLDKKIKEHQHEIGEKRNLFYYTSDANQLIRKDKRRSGPDHGSRASYLNHHRTANHCKTTHSTNDSTKSTTETNRQNHQTKAKLKSHNSRNHSSPDKNQRMCRQSHRMSAVSHSK